MYRTNNNDLNDIKKNHTLSKRVTHIEHSLLMDTCLR